MTLAVKQNKQTILCISSCSPSSMRPERKKATFSCKFPSGRTAIKRKVFKTSKQKLACLITTTKKIQSFFVLTNVSFNDRDIKRISFLIHNFLSSCFVAKRKQLLLVDPPVKAATFLKHEFQLYFLKESRNCLEFNTIEIH